MKKLIAIIPFFGIVFSCNPEPEQTVETAYVNPYLLPENLKYKIPVDEIKLKYKFKRNGMSNVDYLECRLLKEPLDFVSKRLKKARIFYKDNYNELVHHYQEGIYHIQPEQEVASSELHKGNQLNVQNDLLELIDKSAEISGYEKSEHTSIRNREAVLGETGFIGNSIGDPNLAFVDENGIVISDVFNGIVSGSIYLDKILNHHLDGYYFDDESLRQDHENVVLPPGRNYTELEHHWDLAYGYFGLLKDLSHSNGTPLLKDSEKILYNAFVQGRYELSKYRYKKVESNIEIIRNELSKVFAIRAIDYLIGVNTIVNLKEADGTDAFNFLSKAYGLIYSLQFTRNESGELYYTYEQVNSILSNFKKDKGFWDRDRLLADEGVSGSLQNIAKQIAEKYGFSLEEVRR